MANPDDLAKAGPRADLRGADLGNHDLAELIKENAVTTEDELWECIRGPTPYIKP